MSGRTVVWYTRKVIVLWYLPLSLKSTPDFPHNSVYPRLLSVFFPWSPISLTYSFYPFLWSLEPGHFYVPLLFRTSTDTAIKILQGPRPRRTEVVVDLIMEVVEVHLHRL